MKEKVRDKFLLSAGPRNTVLGHCIIRTQMHFEVVTCMQRMIVKIKTPCRWGGIGPARVYYQLRRTW